MFLLDHIYYYFRILINFIFFGSKAFVTKPVVAAVTPITVAEMALEGFVFYPKHSRGKGSPMGWFPYGLGNMLRGKLLYAFPDRSNRWVELICRLTDLVAYLVPTCLLPTVPNTELCETLCVSQKLPLVVWSHGRGGNVADHALLLSQIAVEAPAIVCAVTHTDGSADCYNSASGGMYYYRPTVGSNEPAAREAMAGFKEYQVDLRVRELDALISRVGELGVEYSEIFFGGFDLGGPTALLAAIKRNAPCVSIDGTYCLADRIPFPAQLHTGNLPQLAGSTFVLSDEWDVWHTPVKEQTEKICLQLGGRQITVKQTKHTNFSEFIFWVPFGLRIAGIVHRRGDARKTYRRTTKWLVSLIQQTTTHEDIISLRE